MAAPRLKPFPWSRLPRVSRAEALAAAQARAALAPHLALDQLASDAQSLLHQPVQILSAAVSVDRSPPSVERTSFELVGAGVRFWVEAEAGLVLRVVETLLGVGGGWVDPRKPAPPEALAAWAAFLVALLHRSGRAPVRVVPPFVATEVASVQATVRLAGAPFWLRVGVPLADLPAPSPCFDPAALASLGALPLSLPLVAAQTLASRGDLDELVPGAAWAPGEAWTLRPQPGKGWQGRGLLAAGPGEVAAEVELRALGSALSLVLTRPSVPIPWEPPSMPADSPPDADLASALAEAPLVVRVEVATITLEAQAWARLGPGDVVATGVRLGEPVVLRSGGAVLARGELCDLDGELAVRIVQRP